MMAASFAQPEIMYDIALTVPGLPFDPRVKQELMQVMRSLRPRFLEITYREGHRN